MLYDDFVPYRTDEADEHRGGAYSVSDLRPFIVHLGLVSGSGAWKVTTGANVSAIGLGRFT